MKLAYFDCAFGAAGDMLLGALVGAGLPVEQWLAELAKIDLPQGSFAVEISDVVRCTIASKKVDVHCLPSHSHTHHHSHESDEHAAHTSESATTVGSHSHSVSRTHSASHSHTHSHASSHSHTHEHSHESVHEHGDESERSHEHEHERNLPEILQIIANSKISAAAKSLASKIFTRLGQSEAAVHGLPMDQVHFHEVGAIDAIIDIVGFAIAYDLLGIERSVVSALPVGSGLVKTRHGLFPVPGPAVINLMSESAAPVAASSFTHECLTPTGAAILTTIASSFSSMPSMEIKSSGYGAGTFNPEGFPNVCRVILGQPAPQSLFQSGAESNFESEVIAVLEANLDDISPQLLSFAMERLFAKGALDVSVTPVVMKKSRSGHMLSVVCRPEDRIVLEELILTQTSSLGVRSYLCERLVAQREWQEVTIGNGRSVRVKLARDRQGKLVNAQPEYEDCAAYATEYGVPLKDVLSAALTNLAKEQSAE
ncbi:MAG TPA: nickel pincer cofactor biosynthesis protein LarC [Trichormus sp.]